MNPQGPWPALAVFVIASAVIFTPSLAAAQASQPKPPSQLCIESATNPCPTAETVKSGHKWNPGHYAETQTYGAIPSSVVSDIANVAAIKGVTQRYNWSTLEPTRGQYNFSAIRADLTRLRPYRKRLIVLLMERSWSGTSSVHLPAYLATEPGSNNGIFKHPLYGVYARLWNQVVMDRMIALSAAMAAELDDEPLFEGMRFEEITLGLTPGTTGVPSDYSNAALIQQWLRLAAVSKLQWRRTNVFFNTNTLGGAVGPNEITRYAATVGIGVGGPDVLPPGASDYQIAGDRVIVGAYGGVDYRGRLPIAHSVQTPELGGKEGTFTPQQLADYVIPDVGNTHMSWVIAPSNVTINWASHIRPYLAGNPRPTVQTCPTTYKNGCDRGDY